MSPHTKKGLGFSLVLLGVLVGIVLLVVSDALAAQKISAGRKLWDTIMLWVNFGILVFLFMRYGKKPLMNFLRGESSKIEETLNEVEEQLQNAQSSLKAEEKNFSGTEERIQKIRQDIIEFGLREKERIIEEAKRAADQMVEDTKRKTDHQLEAAKKEIAAEMMGIAVSLASEKLKRAISAEDDEVLINQFIGGLNASGTK